MILPFFIRKNFSKQELLSKTVGFVYKNFRQGDTKNFRQKNVIPPIMNNVFRYPKSSETLKRCPGNFSVLWDHIFPTKVCDKFSIPEIFWNIEGMPTKYFGTRRKKMFGGNTWYPLICIGYFDYPKLSETLKGCPRIFSALWDLKFLTENVIPPIIHKFFRYHNFCKTLQGSSRNFSAWWDQTFSTEKYDTPPFFIRKNFSKREILSKTAGFVYKNFRQGETKKFREKSLIPPIMQKIFRYLKLSGTLKGFPRFFSALRDLKVFTENVVPPIIHKNLRYHSFSKNIAGMLMEFLGPVRPKFLDV